MKQTAKAGKAITVSVIEQQVLDLAGQIGEIDATRVDYDSLAVLTREIKDLIAQRVAYGVPLLASRPSTWFERLCGAGKRMEYILRLERVSYQ